MFRSSLFNGLALIAAFIAVIVIAFHSRSAGRCPYCCLPTYDRPGTSLHECLNCGRVFNPGEAGKPLGKPSDY